MLITQSHGASGRSHRRRNATIDVSSGLFARIKLFIYVHVHATALDRAGGGAVGLKDWDEALQLCGPTPPPNRGRGFCLSTCNVVLYTSRLSIVAVILFLSPVKLRREMVNGCVRNPAAWGVGSDSAGGASLSSWTLTRICLAFYELLFTFLLSVLP